jgi:mannosyl-oligosaccharide alpha-1,2-mannosidase
VFETNIRFVGGLLSMFALTGDEMYKEKAHGLATKLLPAFDTPTGIPHALISLASGASKNYGWASSGSSILSEFGTLHLEFVYLSDVTGDGVFREKVMRIRETLKGMEKPKGLYFNYVHPRMGKFTQSK